VFAAAGAVETSSRIVFMSMSLARAVSVGAYSSEIRTERGRSACLVPHGDPVKLVACTALWDAQSSFHGNGELLKLESLQSECTGISGANCCLRADTRLQLYPLCQRA
jgi:hypothetical protein